MANNLKKLFCFFALLLPVTISAQELPSFKMKIVQRPDGSVYWPLSLPVYIHVGGDTTSHNSVLLSEVKDKDVAIPMKWDGPGIHYLRHFDRLNHAISSGEIAFPVHVDGAAPQTEVKLSGASSFISARQYFGPGLRGTISATDDMSGVETTQISTDENPFLSIASPIDFEQEKEYVLKYFSVDQVGNVEKTKSKIFTVDKTSPTTTLSVMIDNLADQILSPRSLISLRSTDKLSGVKKILVSFDTIPVSLYSKNINPAMLTEGNHILNYYAIDNVNNLEKKVEHSFYLDRTAPVVVPEIIGPSMRSKGKTFVSKNSKIRLTATDNKVGVKEVHLSINGRTPELYESDFPISSLQGHYSVKFRAVDKINNKGSFTTTSDLGNLFVDNTPPVVFHSISDPKMFTRDTLFVTSKSKIALKSVDYESGAANIIFEIDKISPSTYHQPFTISSDGKHMITYEGTDNVTNSSSKQFFIVVDNVAPTLFWHLSLDNLGTQDGLETYPSGTRLFLAAKDNAVGLKSVYFSLDDGPPINYLQAINLASKGKIKVVAWAVDALGNESNHQTIELIVK